MSPPAKPMCAFGLAWTTIASVILLSGCPKKPQTWNPSPPYPSTAGKDFDLSWSKSDANGSPVNPEWAPQGQSPANFPPVKDSPCQKSNKQPYDSQCSDQSGKLVLDTGTGLTGLACDLFGDRSSINGHVDWTVAGAQGSLGFLNFADDFDYNLLLLPDNDTGLTGNNNLVPNGTQRYIEIEFDSLELVDRFGTQWWQDFARLAAEGAQKGGDFTDVEKHLHTGSSFAFGVVYGVFGLDCEHGCRSEFHPAYAVAIQLDDTKDKNTWAIFARNWGNEGFCSHLHHQFNSGGRAMQLLLPYISANPPSGITIQQAASSAENPVGSSSGGQSQWCPSFTFSKNQGEVIEIPLPPAAQLGLTEVVVQFTWPGDASPVPSKNLEAASVLHMLQQKRGEAKIAPTAEEPVEEHIGRLYRWFQGKGMTEQQFGPTVFHQYISKLPAGVQLAPQLSLYSRKNSPLSCSVPETTKLTPQNAGQMKTVKAKPLPLPTDAAKVMWDKATLAAICSAYEASGKKLPPGEPSDTAQKLDKICKDKRLKQ
jgi:hypothetical protein